MIHYIYIPGLGDRLDPLRHLVLWRWKRRNTRVTLVPMHWSDTSETYEQKYARVVKALSRLNAKEIVLVGESAGGAMALFCFSQHLDLVSKVITICGYNQGSAAINQLYRRRNPALYPLLVRVENVLQRLTAKQRQRVTTIYSTLDTVVSARYSRIDGARSSVLRTPGHFLSIGYVLIVGVKRLQ